MGILDQFAKQTFASETSVVTRGALAWQVPPEIRLSHVHADGMLTVLDSTDSALKVLPSPWCEARGHTEILVEVKMQGDHLDEVMLERALLRRQVRQVQRMEASEPPWLGQLPIWLTASILPERISKAYSVKRLARGCYRVQPAFFSFLWIAANELPLVDELVPFLVARSGTALAKFVRWVVRRRPVEWVLNMIQILPMSTSLREEMRRYVPITDDPGVRARQEVVARYLLDILPELRREVREEGREDGRLREARSALRRVLSRRKLSLTAEQDARIDACPEIETLERWLDQAVDAPSAEDALR